MTPNVNLKPQAELFVVDLGNSVDFYNNIDFITLAFKPKERYALVKLEENAPLGLYGVGKDIIEHHYFGKYPSETKKGYGAEFVFTVEDIEKYFRRVTSQLGENVIAKPLTLRNWGVKDFRISDPDGFYLRFTEDFDWLK